MTLHIWAPDDRAHWAHWATAEARWVHDLYPGPIGRSWARNNINVLGCLRNGQVGGLA